jgi:hypothetical protein
LTAGAAGVASERTEHFWLGVDERDRGAGDELGSATVEHVVKQRLRITSDEEDNGTIDAVWDDALAKGQRDGERHAAQKHLAVEVLGNFEFEFRCAPKKTRVLTRD